MFVNNVIELLDLKFGRAFESKAFSTKFIVELLTGTDTLMLIDCMSGTTAKSPETVKHSGGRWIKACLRFLQVSRDFVCNFELDLHLDERLHHLVVHVVVDFLKHEKWGSM